MSIEPGGKIRTRHFVTKENDAGFHGNVPISQKMASALEAEGYREVDAITYFDLEKKFEIEDLSAPLPQQQQEPSL